MTDSSGSATHTVSVSNVPEEYAEATVRELLVAVGLDAMMAESMRFCPRGSKSSAGTVEVLLRYSKESAARDAAKLLHGQKVEGASGSIRVLSTELMQTAQPQLLPSVYLSDMPANYEEQEVRRLHIELGLDASELVSMKFLKSKLEDNGGTRCLIARYRHQAAADAAIKAFGGFKVVLPSGVVKHIGSRHAQPASWMERLPFVAAIASSSQNRDKRRFRSRSPRKVEASLEGSTGEAVNPAGAELGPGTVDVDLLSQACPGVVRQPGAKEKVDFGMGGKNKDAQFLSSSPSSSVFIVGLPAEVNEQLLRDILFGYGEILHCTILPHDGKREDRRALALFANQEQAAAACQGLTGTVPPGFDLPLLLRYAAPFSAEPSTRLWVTGLPANATPQLLQQLFEAYGTLKDHHLMQQAHGHTTRAGLVEMASLEETKLAMDCLSGQQLEDSDMPLAIRFARPDQGTRQAKDKFAVGEAAPHQSPSKRRKAAKQREAAQEAWRAGVPGLAGIAGMFGMPGMPGMFGMPGGVMGRWPWIPPAYTAPFPATPAAPSQQYSEDEQAPEARKSRKVPRPSRSEVPQARSRARRAKEEAEEEREDAVDAPEGPGKRGPVPKSRLAPRPVPSSLARPKPSMAAPSAKPSSGQSSSSRGYSWLKPSMDEAPYDDGSHRPSGPTSRAPPMGPPPGSWRAPPPWKAREAVRLPRPPGDFDETSLPPGVPIRAPRGARSSVKTEPEPFSKRFLQPSSKAMPRPKQQPMGEAQVGRKAPRTAFPEQVFDESSAYESYEDSQVREEAEEYEDVLLDDEAAWESRS